MSELRRCKRCRNVFTYGGPEKLGYSEEFCGAYCDGFYHGRLSLTADREQLLADVEIVLDKGFPFGIEFTEDVRLFIVAARRNAAFVRRVLEGT